MDVAGRRPLLLTALSGMAASSFALALSFTLHSGALAVFALLAFISFFSVGAGSVPWLIMSEIFSTSVRGQASSFATQLNWTCSFIVTLTFPAAVRAVGDAGTFAAYGCVSAGAVAFVWFQLPETKGRTLEEIGASFEDDADGGGRAGEKGGGGDEGAGDARAELAPSGASA